MKSIIIILSCLFFNFVSSQIQNVETKIELRENEFYLQADFQQTINHMLKINHINLKKEFCCRKDILDTKEKVTLFCTLLIKQLAPIEVEIPKIVYRISEDRSKKFWFIIAEIPESCALCSGFNIILVKQNCKVVDFQRPR